MGSHLNLNVRMRLSRSDEARKSCDYYHRPITNIGLLRSYMNVKLWAIWHCSLASVKLAFIMQWSSWLKKIGTIHTVTLEMSVLTNNLNCNRFEYYLPARNVVDRSFRSIYLGHSSRRYDVTYIISTPNRNPILNHQRAIRNRWDTFARNCIVCFFTMGSFA